MGKAGELKRQFKERGIALPRGCLEMTELKELLSHGGVDALPDDAFQQVIAAFSSTYSSTRGGVPLFEEVKGLACSKGMRQQLHRLQPLVGVRSLVVMQRPSHGPWRVTLLYEGELTEALMEQARQGRVRTINTNAFVVTERRVVPELLAADCSLLDFTLSLEPPPHLLEFIPWAAKFGEAAPCSVVLRHLSMSESGVWGPLPELRLPVLQVLSVLQLTGGLEHLQGCTALRHLQLQHNDFPGDLGPLRGCAALQYLDISYNRELTGSLEPLRRCTALRSLNLRGNQLLSGDLGPLRACTELQYLNLLGTQVTGGIGPLRGCTALQILGR